MPAIAICSIPPPTTSKASLKANICLFKYFRPLRICPPHHPLNHSNENTLMSTAYAFLQGLYPPTSSDIEVLSNGTRQPAPLNGYQYVVVNGLSANAPETIWLKGDENCPVATKSMHRYSQSTEFKDIQNSSADFYQSLKNVLDPVYTDSQIGYQNAYGIFDYLNCESIQNNSSIVTPHDLDQLRVLADQHEFALSYTPHSRDRSIGGMSFIGALIARLNETAFDPSRKSKLTYFAGSYDTFLAVFGLLGLSNLNQNFIGLPQYASMMSFELLAQDTSDLVVRFNFRNGTVEEMYSYPLFGKDEIDLPWTEFLELTKFAIRDAKGWCNACGLSTGFCAEYTSLDFTKRDPVSLVAAGIMGAACMFVVLGILSVGPRIIRQRRRNAVKLSSIDQAEKTIS
ncbi:Lysosomal acid phosphatase [Neolecta irregularis DAH-3]|uniref:Lysosomal acid phosphatase n=1 Tax=Neolecta irregularis (strain DAH-3) TaxID=1198029 RepID=A0A1U7LUN5_NEOID|nr:Lysosomal acid phosphatase [Neolecta irregularis DAH-3]|eukprot:OLL26377.1 Lysosomal acid phosphatase [Neolecta irregularis DAH-3]